MWHALSHTTAFSEYETLYHIYAGTKQQNIVKGVENNASLCLCVWAGAMDTFARALLAAEAILSEGVLPAAVAERYSTFDSGLGAKFENGEATLEDMEVL